MKIFLGGFFSLEIFFIVMKILINCDVIRWEQLENWHFSKEYNFWTINDRILKTPTCPYSCLANDIVMPRTCLNVLYISCRLMKNVRYRTVPIWLLHTVTVKMFNLMFMPFCVFIQVIFFLILLTYFPFVCDFIFIIHIFALLLCIPHDFYYKEQSWIIGIILTFLC